MKVDGRARAASLGMLMALVLFSPLVPAAGAGSIQARTEASMVVTGNLTVAPDGHVQGYSLDHPRELPGVVTDLIARNIQRWHFQPVLLDGAPVLARARMSLRVVAKPASPGRYAIRVHGVHFGDAGSAAIRWVHVFPPQYPHDAVFARVSGTVFVALRIGPTGAVEDAAAEQVNLGMLASERDMRRWRHLLAESAVRTARRWTFSPAASEPGGVAEPRYATVPVSYNLRRWGGGTSSRSRYGHWKLYIPGPRQPIPWWDSHQMLSDSADALPESGLFPMNSRLHLTTPLGGA